MRRVILCVVPVVVVAAGIVAWRSLAPSRPTGGPNDGQGSSDREVADHPGLAPLSSATISHAAGSASRNVAQPRREALRRAIIDTLTVLSSGTAEEWLAYLDAYGIDRPDSAEANPQGMRRQWQLARALLAGARLNVDDLAVVGRFEELQSDDWGGSKTPSVAVTHNARRDAARAFLRDVPEDHRQVMRMTIPGVFAVIEGEEFEADLRMEFTFNPRSGQWVLTEVGMKGDNGVKGPVVFML
ncbi:MAG: hypothetical protein H6811_02765 [Phycisphaeraceae bacterium]|nr:hypothetical protein [Phycisphaeraceae bacterium]